MVYVGDYVILYGVLFEKTMNMAGRFWSYDTNLWYIMYYDNWQTISYVQYVTWIFSCTKMVGVKYFRMGWKKNG